MLRSILDAKKIGSDRNLPYVAQGTERERIMRARKLSQTVLLTGSTGIGKSLLAESIAQELVYPYIELICNQVMTPAKILGASVLSPIPVDISGSVQTLQLMTFMPKGIGLAALAGSADIPVVLFIDELHKMWSGADTVLHPLAAQHRVNLEEILGETYQLHPDSLVIFALNPYYGLGIDEVGTALRARFKTIMLDPITAETMLMKIVVANIPEAGEASGEIKNQIQTIIRVTTKLAKIWQNVQQDTDDNDTSLSTIGTAIRKSEVSGGMVETPCPRAVVECVRSIIDGESFEDAIRDHLVNTVVRNFGIPARALMHVYETF